MTGRERADGILEHIAHVDLGGRIRQNALFAVKNFITRGASALVPGKCDTGRAALGSSETNCGAQDQYQEQQLAEHAGEPLRNCYLYSLVLLHSLFLPVMFMGIEAIKKASLSGKERPAVHYSRICFRFRHPSSSHGPEEGVNAAHGRSACSK